MSKPEPGTNAAKAGRDFVRGMAEELQARHEKERIRKLGRVHRRLIEIALEEQQDKQEDEST